MIKKLVILVMMGLLLMPATLAFADVPPWIDDPFFEKHERDCKVEERYYTVNSASGSIDIVVEPGSSRKVAEARNGTTLYVMFTYERLGKVWGVGWPDLGDEWGATGWFKMDELEVQYDKISFSEEFGAEFYQYTGNYRELMKVEDLVLWTYPGSGVRAGTYYGFSGENVEGMFSYAWRDEQGREWGYISYYVHTRDVWVCISDPGNPDIPAFGPGVAGYQSGQQGSNGGVIAVDSGGFAISGILAIALVSVLVVAVVVTTAILIWVFYRRGKKRT